MPVEMRMAVSPENDSYFFFWSKSFVLYNKVLFFFFGREREWEKDIRKKELHPVALIF